jgi:hypothetical protein
VDRKKKRKGGKTQRTGQDRTVRGHSSTQSNDKWGIITKAVFHHHLKLSLTLIVFVLRVFVIVSGVRVFFVSVCRILVVLIFFLILLVILVRVFMFIIFIVLLIVNPHTQAFRFFTQAFAGVDVTDLNRGLPKRKKNKFHEKHDEEKNKQNPSVMT